MTPYSFASPHWCAAAGVWTLIHHRHAFATVIRTASGYVWQAAQATGETRTVDAAMQAARKALREARG